MENLVMCWDLGMGRQSDGATVSSSSPALMEGADGVLRAREEWEPI